MKISDKGHHGKGLLFVIFVEGLNGSLQWTRTFYYKTFIILKDLQN